MFLILVLSSLLILSIVGIVILVVYKMVRVGAYVEADMPETAPPAVFKEKLSHIYGHICDKGTHSVLPKAKNIYHTVRKSVSDKHVAFTDTVKGKRNTDKKGTASFFLKSVSEHKKAMKDKK